MNMTWDRGTLVFPADAPVGELPGVRWDPRAGVWRAPGRFHAPLREALGVPWRPLPLRAPPAVEPPALREYQEDALAAWELAGCRGVIVLPTGAGKTRVATAAIARSRLRTLCVVPTRALLEQWVRVLADAGLAPGVFGDGERREAPVTIATYASARLYAEGLGDRFDLLVVDEAHHFGGSSNEILEMSIAGRRLGLTATPPDGDRLAVLTDLLGPIVWHQVIADLAGEWLAPFEVVTLTIPLDPAEQAAVTAEDAVWKPVVRAFFDGAPGASWADLVRTAQRTQEGQRVLAAWRRSRAIAGFSSGKREAVRRLVARRPQARILVFTPDNTAAYALSRELLVPAITCDIGRGERARVLEAFAAGRVRILVSARVLNEGVDVPAADIAILLGGSQGAREYVQRVGRILRPAEGKQAFVYELVTRGTTEGARVEQHRGHLAGR